MSPNKIYTTCSPHLMQSLYNCSFQSFSWGELTWEFWLNAKLDNIWCCKVYQKSWWECRNIPNKQTKNYSQLMPYPSSYAAPNLLTSISTQATWTYLNDTHPVPRNKCPALSPLVLSFHWELRSNNSSSNNSARSPLRGRSIKRRPRRCRSMPLPVAASRVRVVWVWMARRRWV